MSRLWPLPAHVTRIALGTSLVLGAFPVLVTVFARKALADSDGYFCIGAGFIAVEFRAFSTPGLNGPHVLKIARYDPERGPRWAGEVMVEEFQTHTLTCGAKTILFEGAGERGRGLVSYIIQLDSAGPPRIVSHTSDPSYKFRTFPRGPDNIGNLAQPGMMELPSRGGYPRFHLRVTNVSRRVESGVQHDMQSVLEEIDALGRVGRSLAIYKGGRYESVDDGNSG
jgi:hypothetical protein